MKIHRIEWRPNWPNNKKVALNLDVDFIVAISEPELEYKYCRGNLYVAQSIFKIYLDTAQNAEHIFQVRDSKALSLELTELQQATGEIPEAHQHLVEVYEKVLAAWKSPYNRQS